MFDVFDKESIDALVKLYLSYAKAFAEDQLDDIGEDKKEQYRQMFRFLAAPVDGTGEYNAEITEAVLEELADYQVRQYAQLAKEKEIVLNELPIDHNIKDSNKEKFAEGIAVFNTQAGKNAAAINYFMQDFTMDFEDNSNKSLRKDMYRMADLRDPNRRSGTAVFEAILEKKKAEYRATLSEEDKKYFDKGLQINLFATVPNKDNFKKLPADYISYAERKENDCKLVLKEESVNYFKDNRFLKQYEKINALITDKREPIKNKGNELRNVVLTPGHRNSDAYQKIIDSLGYLEEAYNKKKLDNEKDGVFSNSVKGIKDKKKIAGSFFYLEQSLVEYLEDKWKPRRSPMGKQRFAKAFELLEQIDPEKAQILKDYHAEKNKLKSKLKDNFNTFYQKKIAQANDEWTLINNSLEEAGQVKIKDSALKNHERVSIADIAAEEGLVQNSKKTVKVTDNKSLENGKKPL